MKRARYDGESAVTVAWPPAAVHPENEWTVEPGHHLPDDAPAALRDDLTKNHPFFTEVTYTPPGAKKDDTKDGE